MKKKLVLSVITMLVILSTQIKALAAPEVINTNGIDILFDSDYYAANNPDITELIGTEKDALLQHYILFGQYEGRLAYAPETKLPTQMATNQYGNTMGNLYNDGFFVHDTADNSFYFYNVYENCVEKTDAITGNTSIIFNKPLFSLNYNNGTLYGTELTSDLEPGNLIAYDIATGNSTTLHAAPVRHSQLVNNELYFTNLNDRLLRKLNVETREETILTTQPVYYPVVYKNMVVFQLYSDNESLYVMPKDGGQMTKLNNYHSHFPLIYNDVVYYQSNENGVCRLRSINLDGTGDAELMTANFGNMNIYDGKYYFIRKDAPNKIYYIELSDNNHIIKELPLEASIRKSLNETYGANSIDVTSYSTIQFAGDHLLVMCREIIDGDKYVDEYIYAVNTNDVIIIPEFCTSTQTAPSLANASKEEQALAVAQSIANSIPEGSDLERVRAAAEIVAEYCDKAIYTSADPDYRTAYGVLCKGVYTCAGSTRALGLVLECMGYRWTHANENMYTHQWCELVMDGQFGWADGMGGIADYGICPFQSGDVYQDANGWIYTTGF